MIIPVEFNVEKRKDDFDTNTVFIRSGQLVDVNGMK